MPAAEAIPRNENTFLPFSRVFPCLVKHGSQKRNGSKISANSVIVGTDKSNDLDHFAK